MSTALLEQNLACIATHSPQLADAIRRAQINSPQEPTVHETAAHETATHEHAVTMQTEAARSGAVGLTYLHAGRTTSAHSRIDPQREAERFVSRLPPGELYICVGFGMGYYVEALLRRDTGCCVLIVEYDYEALHVALSGRDMSALLSDRRIDWLVAPRRGEIAEMLHRLWIPTLMGAAVIVPLRTRIETRSAFFGAALGEIEHCLAGLRQSYRTQAAFGRRWLHNMILNLPAIITPENGTDRRMFEEVAVVLAGPTLATHLDEIAALKVNGAHTALIVVDTALPIMRARGIVPDIVLSIDCQQISYLHFMAGLDRRTRLALAIGSPPILARQTEGPLFCRSDHPLAHYIDRRLGGLQAIDMSAGNVGHAAYSLALSLGARRIRLFGDDFRYTGGAPYPRGVYLYDYFANQCQRLQPMEGALYGFMLRDPAACRISDGSYTTPLLTTYRRRFEYFVGDVAQHAAYAHQSATSPSGAPAALEWQDLLREYSDGIADLPTPTAPFRFYFEQIDEAERLLVLTLAPLIAYMRLHDGIALTDSFDRARHYTRRLIARRLRHA